MEYYANLHSQQYQLQEQAVARTTLPTLQTTVLPSTSNKLWNSTNFILNDATGSDVYNHHHHHQLTDEAIPNPRVWSHHEDFRHHYELPLSNNIKEETSADYFSKLSTQERNNNINNNPLEPNKLLSTNFNHSFDLQVDSIWPYSNSEVVYSNTGTSTFGGFNNLRYGHLSDAFRGSSTNYKTASDSVPCSSSSLGFNLHGLDLLSSNHSSNQSSTHVNLGLYNKHSACLGYDQDVQESRDSPSSNSSNTTTGFINEVSRTKRPPNSGFSEPKVSQASAKKSRPTLRSSNPPLKIRKEKLGDRIAALHRLVAPFGKTDTASVLTEAIGYIQFLHDQVQTLSVPYMKSLHNKPSRKMQQVLSLSREEEKETNVDLRSRGLCLVPKSCVSYFSDYD